MDEKLLTPQQVAERLQLTERTIYEYMRSGQLKASKLGRVWRVNEEDLADFLRKKQSR